MTDTPTSDDTVTDPLAPGERNATIRWDDDNMATGFANVVNIQGTREQVELFFGTYKSYSFGNSPDVSVDLTNRMILTPLAAKRLNTILTNVIREYELRHGVLRTDEGA